MTSREFVKAFKEEVAAHPKLRARHPFVKAIGEGRLSMDQLREWAKQDYKFRNIVPRIAMMRYLACSDPEFAKRLYGVVEEETRGLETGTAGHIELFLEFAGALGLSRKDLDDAPLAPATAAHLYYVELMIHKYPWFVVMAAQIAAEGTFPEATRAIGKGLREHYDLRPEAIRFFTVHDEADEDHSSLAEEIAVRYLQTPELQALTREVGLRRFELLYDTWSLEGFPTK